MTSMRQFSGSVVAAAAIAFAVVQPTGVLGDFPDKPSESRFQSTAIGQTLFLIDKETGQVWRLVDASSKSSTQWENITPQIPTKQQGVTSPSPPVAPLDPNPTNAPPVDPVRIEHFKKKMRRLESAKYVWQLEELSHKEVIESKTQFNPPLISVKRDDHAWILWDPVTGVESAITGFTGARFVAVFPDGKRVLVCNERDSYVFDIASQTKAPLLKDPAAFYGDGKSKLTLTWGCALSPDGNIAILRGLKIPLEAKFSEETGFYLVDTKTGLVAKSITTKVSLRGQTVISANGKWVADSDSGIWDITKGELRFEGGFSERLAGPMILSHDGERWAAVVDKTPVPVRPPASLLELATRQTEPPKVLGPKLGFPAFRVPVKQGVIGPFLLGEPHWKRIVVRDFSDFSLRGFGNTKTNYAGHAEAAVPDDFSIDAIGFSENGQTIVVSQKKFYVMAQRTYVVDDDDKWVIETKD